MAPNGALEVFFRLIQTLPTFWAERIWILRIFVFEMFWIPNFWISRFPDLQIPRFPDFQPPAAAPPPDEFSDPNLPPLPKHPRIKYVARALAAI